MLWLAIGLVIGFIIGFAMGFDGMEKKIKKKIKNLLDSKDNNFFNDEFGSIDSEYFNKNLFGDK